VFPDGYLGPGAGTAFQTTWFDYVWVQFYNNYCGLDSPSEFNFNSWANWASTISINPNVKIFIGAPASSTAAGSGYVSIATLQSYSTTVMNQYRNYGGIMLWDASAAQLNNNFGNQIAAFLGGSPPNVPNPPPAILTTADQTTGTTVIVGHTTGKPISQTTGKTVTVGHTTGKPLSQTTGNSPNTAHTTGKTHHGHTTNAPQLEVETTGTTGQAVVAGTGTTGTNGQAAGSGIAQTGTGASTTSCISGHMRCETSETYQSCANEVWEVAQDCQVGTTCTPSGVYIYCE